MFLSDYEKQYMDALKRIYNNGFSDGVNERTGKATKRLPGIVIQVDLEKEFPILKSKQVFAKTALREILWIWQLQSNNIHNLKAKIWDEWADSNGAIGEAYGAQVAKPVCIYTDPVHKTPESFRAYKNQTEFILEYLREFPNGRWGNVTLWNVDELSKMNLVPCCHTITWNLDGGRLNCVLDQRSGDMPYGVPFNTTQYAELTILFANDLGVKPGILTHVIADAHIYDNQMDGVALQLKNYELLKKLYENTDTTDRITKLADELAELSSSYTGKKESGTDVIYKAKKALETEPKLVADTKDFFSVSDDEVYVDKYNHMGKIEFGEVAV